MPEFVYDESKIDRKAWGKFVFEHPYGNIFQTPEMYDVNRGVKKFTPVFTASIEGGKITGLISTAIITEKDGAAGWLTKRCIVVGGPLLSGDMKVDEFIEKFDNRVKNKCLYSRIANLYDVRKEMEPLINKNYVYYDHLNYLFDLTKGEESLWKNLHETRRRQIKRGYKRGITIKVSDRVDNLKEYYKILEITYSKNKIPIHDYSLFENAYKILAPAGYLKFVSAYSKDKLIGHRILLTYKGSIFYWYAGSLPEESNLYPNDVLVWETLKWGTNNNYTLFDFGGGGYPDKEYGVRDFKKKFGGTEVCYGNYLKIYQPLKYKILKTALMLYKKI